jgi:methionyl-tRNA formyltransferase
MSDPLRIVFFGTPDFAVPSLEILVRNNFHVIAVVTVPDKPVGRGQKISVSPIKEFAVANNIRVLQPENLKDEKFSSELESLKPDLQVVVAFRMLPEKIWKLPRRGTFNLHASLLPQYRGAAPINWAIIHGEKMTGVTTFFLKHEIDTGDIIMQESTDIGSDETAGELHDRLMKIGAGLVLKTVQAISSGKVAAVKQPEPAAEALRPAPKLNRINTMLSSKQLYSDAFNFIRGLSPYPAAHTEFFNPESGVSLALKVFSATAHAEEHGKVPGTIVTDNRNFIRVYFRKGFLELQMIQIAGRNKVSVKDFLNGFKLEGDWKLRS